MSRPISRARAAGDASPGPEELQPTIRIAQHILREVRAARSPLVLFDRAVLRGQVRLWRTHLPEVEPHFAIKSCDALGVLAHLHAEELSFDAATGGEIRLLERVGVPPERVICTHPIRDEDDLQTILRYRPRALVVDSPEEVRKLRKWGIPSARYAPELFLRIELPFGGLSQKFGIEVVHVPPDAQGQTDWVVVPDKVFAVVDEAQRSARECGTPFARFGFSSHVGTNTFRTEKYESMLRVFVHLRDELRRRDVEVAAFDLGGGYCDTETPRSAGTTQEAFLAELGEIVQRYRRAHPDVELLAEPGRFMVSNSGAIVIGVTQVDTRELLPHSGHWKRERHLKVQMNDGLYGNLLGELHDEKSWNLHAFRVSAAAPPHSTWTLQAILNGKTCDSWDRLGATRPLPEDLRAGDQLLVPQAGAYTLVTGTDFNSAPRSQVCLYEQVADGRLELELFDIHGTPVPIEPGGTIVPTRSPVTIGSAWNFPSRGLTRMPRLADVVGSHAGRMDQNHLRPKVVGGDPRWSEVRSLVARNEATLKSVDVTPVAMGGMGWVLEMVQPDLHRVVALKIGKSPARGSLGERFRNEAAKTAALKDDPRIPAVHDFGILPDGDHPYYLMELVLGLTLHEWIPEFHTPEAREEGGIDWRAGIRARALQHVRDVAQALEFAHAKGVLHRDVKPANMIVPNDTRLPIKVVDWGLFKSLHEAEPEAAGESPDGGEAVLGTVDYMSPEQARGEALTKASDVWALGATLYHVVCGRPPLEHHGDEQARLDALRSSPDPIAAPFQFTAEVPRELESMIQKALRINPDERYESMAALAADVASYLAREPVSSHREKLRRSGPFADVGYRSLKAVESRPRAVLITGLVLVTAIAVAVWMNFRLSEQNQRTKNERTVAEASLGYLGDFVEEAILAGDSRTMAGLLDRAAASAGEAGIPERVQMRLFARLGAAYLDLHLTTKARDLLEIAHPWVEANVDPLSEERAALLEEVADLASSEGENELARQLMQECLEVYETLKGPIDPTTIRVLAKLSAKVGPFSLDDQAELLSLALERARETLGPDHALTRSLEIDRGSLLLSMGRVQEARVCLSEDLEAWAIEESLADPNASMLRMVWARLHAAMGRVDDSIAVLEETLANAREHFGARSPICALIQSTLAVSLQELGRLDEAREIQEELVEYARSLYDDPDHPNRISSLNNLGITETRLGLFDAADERFAVVYESRMRVHGPDAMLTGQVLLNWGTNDSLAGREELAEQRLREALRICDAQPEASHAECIRRRRTLGIHLRNCGHFESSEPLLLETVRECEELIGPDSPTTWNALTNLAKLYTSWGKPERARSAVEQYVEWSAGDPEHQNRARQMLAELDAQ